MRCAPLVLLAAMAGSAQAAPVWLENPISFTAMIDCTFFQRLHYYVTDSAGKDLTFTKTSGPKWLTVTSDGHLEGTPKGEPDTLQVFTLEASDGVVATSASLELWVENRDPPCLRSH